MNMGMEGESGIYDKLDNNQVKSQHKKADFSIERQNCLHKTKGPKKGKKC